MQNYTFFLKYYIFLELKYKCNTYMIDILHFTLLQFRLPGPFLS